jgi:predicted AAA+ superfamily ATPase
VRTAHDAIITYYARDISKYAPKDKRLVIRNIFDLIPSELSSQNRRFKLSSIKDVKRFTQIEDEFLWLTKANVALATYNVNAPTRPLLISENHSLFKLFQSDTGLLTSRFSKESSIGILDGKPAKHMGGIYENFVAQELAAHGFDLRYFSSKKIGELDFVLERRDGSIIALEVKSGAGYRSHAALNNALAVTDYDISEAMVLAETNVEKHGNITYFPAYLVSMMSV